MYKSDYVATTNLTEVMIVEVILKRLLLEGECKDKVRNIMRELGEVHAVLSESIKVYND